jgi:hypothetical protein
VWPEVTLTGIATTSDPREAFVNGAFIVSLCC